MVGKKLHVLLFRLLEIADQREYTHIAMTIAYFDCFAGAAGDMFVGAWLAAGCDFAALQAEIAKLDISGYSLSTESVTRGGLGGTKFNVNQDTPPADQPKRHLSDIVAIIDAADLPGKSGQTAKAIFTRIARAEAQVHSWGIEEVHFHEVGAIDSIVDIVAACVALELMGVTNVCCSAIPTGSGTVKCDHGTLPVPAPATAELLRGAPTLAGPMEGEATTPTAAAFLVELTENFGGVPAMVFDAIGYGAGSRESKTVPNLLRVLIGRACTYGAEADSQVDTVVELATNIDDCTGELLGATIEQLLEAGCLDAWASPVFMKKSRPAWMLSAICRQGDVGRAERIIYSETTTFGIRRRTMTRSKLTRRFETVETPYGPIRMKLGAAGGVVITASPEFADCKAAGASHHVAIRAVMEAATIAYRRREN